jgi:hypothetical protein
VTGARGTGLTLAAEAVRRARRRLAAAAFVRGAAGGIVLSGATALAAAVVLRGIGNGLPAGLAPSLLAVPALGAALGGCLALRRAPGDAEAALLLDRAAGTDEAFVTAITASDAGAGFRELAAAWAIERCGPERVVRVLPLPVPTTAGVGVLLSTALAAVVLTGASGGAGAPAGSGTAGEFLPVRPGSGAGTAAGLAKALREDDAARWAPLATEVRADLPALDRDVLRDLAEALAGKGSELAASARDALDRGHDDVAADLLRKALRFGDAGPGAAVAGGTGAGAVPTAGSGTPESALLPRVPATWSPRYDAAIRRWYEEQTKK